MPESPKILSLPSPPLHSQWEKMLCGPETHDLAGPPSRSFPPESTRIFILTNVHATRPASRSTDGAPPRSARRRGPDLASAGMARPMCLGCPIPARPRNFNLPANCWAKSSACGRLQRQSAPDAPRTGRSGADRRSLTGLANRRAWDRNWPFGWLLPGDWQRRLCLALLDLDQFKEINDNQGHAAGDRVLQAVAAHTAEHLRRGDFVARLGGDEFGLFAVGTGRARGGRDCGMRVRSRVADAVGAQLHPQITASAGFARVAGLRQPDTCESLYLAADAGRFSRRSAAARDRYNFDHTRQRRWNSHNIVPNRNASSKT